MFITNVESIHSDMADHDLLFADLEFLDQAEGSAYSGNRALGQEVTVSSTSGDTNAYDMVDYNIDTFWQSDEQDEQEIIVELDRVYNGRRAAIIWGTEYASAYTLSTSVDGVNYTIAAEVQDHENEQDEISPNGEMKFLKLNLLKKADADQGYQIKSFEVYGDLIKPAPVSTGTNLLPDGGIESRNGWEFKNASEEGVAVYEFIYDSDAFAGSYAAKITRQGEDPGDGRLSQTISLNPNKRYQLSFWHRGDPNRISIPEL